MDSLFKQLGRLPASFASLPARLRWTLFTLVAAAAALAVAISGMRANDEYQYAFTNLAQEDSAEATVLLTGAGIPHRLDAGGTALAVPAAKVYDVRLLLAAAGLPRGGGTGFELFDKGDLGVSEFTRKVNLRRALEGELARTIGRLVQVRSARVHLTLEEKSLFRDEDRKASAAVVLNLKPGTTLAEKELAGIRHLVASAVPGLDVEGVTIVDGRGAVLQTADGPGQAAAAHQRAIEQDLEKRLVTLLEPVAGVGSVIARVTASLDESEVSTSAEVVDPEQTALRSDHRIQQSQQQDQINPSATAAGPSGSSERANSTSTPIGNRNSFTTEDESHDYQVSKTTTTTVVKTPRLKRLSVAVLVDGVDGKARSDEEVKRLGELARRAVGFDPLRGDQFDISSVAFTRSAEEATPAAPAAKYSVQQVATLGGGVLLAALLLFGIVAFARAGSGSRQVEIITPGLRVIEAQAALESARAAAPQQQPQSLPPTGQRDPDAAVRDRARELATMDPNRATYLLRAWVAADSDGGKGAVRG
jgi:flagellar M-ring protein FliF